MPPDLSAKAKDSEPTRFSVMLRAFVSEWQANQDLPNPSRSLETLKWVGVFKR